MDGQRDITALLADWQRGDAGAVDRILPLVYDELRRIAHRQLRVERPGHTLSTTALVHEAYIKLVDQTRAQWADRGHFLAVAAGAMRRILVDYARRDQAAKRGGGQHPVTFDDALSLTEDRADTLVAVDEALTRLAALDERLSRVVECRFFGGLTEEETATALQVTARTVRRDWVKAKGWLYQELHDVA
ncbi:MAG: sigma-70 family RNA polymerase sigma factor [Gemmatimonadota bacterium]|nr:sigma-70 family RNA polymerase sigma factor [Gemmatimonadota bacterium]